MTEVLTEEGHMFNSFNSARPRLRPEYEQQFEEIDRRSAECYRMLENLGQALEAAAAGAGVVVMSLLSSDTLVTRVDNAKEAVKKRVVE